MKPTSTILPACVILGISAFAWVAIISLVLVHFLELPSPFGWLISASLGVSMAFSLAVIAYEMKHAIELPDSLDPEDFNGLLPDRHSLRPV